MKSSIFILTLLLATTVTTRNVQAKAYFTVESDGSVHINVLGESDQIETESEKVVKKIATAVLSEVTDIVIHELEGRVQMALSSTEGTTTYQFEPKTGEPLLEIKSDELSEKVVINKLENGFEIEDRGVVALTTLPITLKSKTREVLVETEKGQLILNTLPADALSLLVRANVINTIPTDAKIELRENEAGGVDYIVLGEKGVSFLNKAHFKANVSAVVSGTDGTVTSIIQPKWLTLFQFLFS